MKCTLKLLPVICVGLVTFSSSCLAQTAKLDVLNLKTRELKTYVFGASGFIFDVVAVPGWKKCEGLPVKRFDFYGVPTIRVELYCYTNDGTMSSVSCVSSRRSPIEATLLTLLGKGTKWKAADELQASGRCQDFCVQGC